MKTIPPILLCYLFIMCLSFVKAQDSTNSNINTKILIKGKKLIYQSHILNDRVLEGMIDNVNFSETKKIRLWHTFAQMNRYKNNEKFICPSFLIIGFATVLITSPFVTAPNHTLFEPFTQQVIDITIMGVIIGAHIRITSCVFANINRNKRLNKRIEIAKLYNEFN